MNENPNSYRWYRDMAEHAPGERTRRDALPHLYARTSRSDRVVSVRSDDGTAELRVVRHRRQGKEWAVKLRYHWRGAIIWVALVAGMATIGGLK